MSVKARHIKLFNQSNLLECSLDEYRRSTLCTGRYCSPKKSSEKHPLDTRKASDWISVTISVTGDSQVCFSHYRTHSSLPRRERESAFGKRSATKVAWPFTHFESVPTWHIPGTIEYYAYRHAVRQTGSRFYHLSVFVLYYFSYSPIEIRLGIRTY